MSAIDYKNVGRPAIPIQHQLATQKQLDFIHSLLGQHELTEANRRSLDAAFARGINKREASDIINWLKALPRKSTRPAVENVNLEGMHKVGDRIFKVQVAVHGSGNLYAKELVLVERDSVEIEDGVWHDYTATRFEYAKGAMRFLSADTKMTLEEAKQFGALYGTCCVCGRTLTNEDSIEAGIGPVCAKGF